jgi:AraC-like DNA-binding protein
MLENLFVSFTGLMGFFTICLMLLRYKSNRIANVYLLIIFIIISARLLMIGFYNLINNNNFITTLLNNYNNVMIVIAPCLFLYFKNLITNTKLAKYNDIRHFVVPFLFVFFDLFTKFIHCKIDDIKYYYYLFFILYCTVYFITIYRNLNQYIWKRNGEINLAIQQNKLIKEWSKYLLFFMILVAARLIVSLFIEINNQSNSFGTSYLWVGALIWAILFFKILVSPEILYGYNFLYKKIDEYKNPNESQISFWDTNPKSEIINLQDLQLKEKIEVNILEYMKQIDQFSFGNETYRVPKFSLSDLSNKLQIPKSHLVYLFKYHSKISFPEYKKIVRIHDGLELIKADYLKNNTFESLSQKIGFASYNTFFVSFKDVTGVTPQEFIFGMVKKNAK